MATISSLGIGSGLPLNDLLSQLASAERQKLTPITQQQRSYQAKVSALGKLESALDKFQQAAAKLNTADAFRAVKSSVSGEGVSAAASTSAVPGTYEISVTTLAKAQSLTAPGVADKTAQQGTGAGTISITQNGTTHDISIADGKSSLEDIRDAINASGVGATASIINDGDPNVPYRLVLTSDSTGTQSEMSLATSGNNTRLADLFTFNSADNTGTMTETVNSSDASLTVNGVAISSQSNRLEEAIQGVTLDLEKAGATATLTVSQDKAAITGSVQSFVDAYNSLQKTMDGLTSFDSETGAAGKLLGDATMRSVESRLRSVMSDAVAGSELSMLSDVGVELKLDGKLEVNSEKLNDLIATAPEKVSRFFSGDAAGAEGLADKLDTTLGQMLDDKGLLGNATSGLKDRISSLDTRYERTERSIDATIERYRKQFAQMDALVSQMNSTMSYLGQQFDAMNAQLGRK